MSTTGSSTVPRHAETHPCPDHAGIVFAWYGLAVIREGGLTAFFAHPAHLALVIIGAILAGVGKLSKKG